MRRTHLAVGLAALKSALVAADVTQWMTQWSTTTCWSTESAKTMWETQYSTTTCWSTETPPAIVKTLYDTVTSSETIYDTIVSSKTIYDTVTAATTLEIPYTTTSVVEKDFTTTIYSSYAQVVTSVETSVATVTKVLVSTVTVASYATSIQTSINVVPGKGYTSTVFIQNTETITQACFTPTPTLTGLVVCSSRITNEQGYVPPTSLPSTYLWGCPPGKLCKPQQTGCNFEAGVYADTYICAPKDCIVAEMPPPSEPFGPYADDVNSTCPFFEPFDDYPLLAPSLFGLDYNEYAVTSLGISASSCPPAVPPPQPTTTTTTSAYVPPPTTTTTTTTTYSPIPVSSSTTQWLPWTTSSYVLPPSSTSTQWLPWTKSSSWAPPSSPSTWSSYGPPPPAVSSSSWAEWSQSSYSPGWGSSATTAWAHGSTPRALAARAITAPVQCQSLCNVMNLDAQYTGKVYSKLCTSSAPFQVASSKCQSCLSAYRTAQPNQIQVILTDLNQFLDVCSSGPPRTSTHVSAPAVETTSSTIKTTTTSSKPPPTSNSKPPPTTTTASPTTTPPTTISTTTTTSSTPPAPPISSTTPSSSSSSSTTPVPPPVNTSTSTLCLVSEISDGQPQATNCPAPAATTTSANTSISSYTGTGNGAQATGRPVAAMVIGVVVVVALV